jgi:hypothetical protein
MFFFGHSGFGGIKLRTEEGIRCKKTSIDNMNYRGENSNKTSTFVPELYMLSIS